MSEIHERNRFLRLAVNIALIAAYVIVAIWQLALVGGEGRRISTLDEQVPILEHDVAVKEQQFLTEQTLLEMTRKELTAQEAVKKSQELQEMRESLEGSREQLEAKKEERNNLQQRKRNHNLVLIVGIMALAVLLWVNWMLNY